MKLAEKWQQFKKKLPEACPPQQVAFAQACYLAGAQASFQILGAASDGSREDAIIIWGELQQEILGAVARPKEESLIVKPESGLIV